MQGKALGKGGPVPRPSLAQHFAAWLLRLVETRSTVSNAGFIRESSGG